jgi:hypothetical protein
MRRLILAPLVPLLAIALGCGGADSFTLAPTDANVAGTFLLHTANGHSLPVDAGATLDGSAEIYQTADVMTLDGAGKWTELTTLALQSNIDNSEQTQTTASTGAYTIEHGQIDFVRTLNGAATFSGSVTGATLTIRYNGSTLVYERQ